MGVSKDMGAPNPFGSYVHQEAFFGSCPSFKETCFGHHSLGSLTSLNQSFRYISPKTIHSKHPSKHLCISHHGHTRFPNGDLEVTCVLNLSGHGYVQKRGIINE